MHVCPGRGDWARHVSDGDNTHTIHYTLVPVVDSIGFETGSYKAPALLLLLREEVDKR